MKKSSVFILAGVLLLTVSPFWWGSAPAPGAGVARFSGADAQALAMIATLAPDYEPWFAPVHEPASEEIASLLFALQAALGAGVIGYWLGVSVTREKLRQASQSPTAASASAEHRAD